jgi:hypothetical protein
MFVMYLLDNLCCKTMYLRLMLVMYLLDNLYCIL